MTDQKSICVFCGSSVRAPSKYMELARGVGRVIAQANFKLIYGGSCIGLMGAMADEALAHGGKVIGVIPEFLKNKEVAHKGLTELHLTETMHERQVGMADRADAFLVLPGGLGTLAEFFEILTWKQLALHNKPIAILNGHGYFDSLLAFKEHAGTEQFLYPGDDELFAELENIEGLAAYLNGLRFG